VDAPEPDPEVREPESGEIGSFQRPFQIKTVIFDLETQQQIAWLDGVLWPPVGAVIELGAPNRDAVVVGVRLVITPISTDVAHIIVDVNDPKKEGEIIPRHPVDRMLDE
jgi:hypothetical protein